MRDKTCELAQLRSQWYLLSSGCHKMPCGSCWFLWPIYKNLQGGGTSWCWNRHENLSLSGLSWVYIENRTWSLHENRTTAIEHLILLTSPVKWTGTQVPGYQGSRSVVGLSPRRWSHFQDSSTAAPSFSLTCPEPHLCRWLITKCHLLNCTIWAKNDIATTLKMQVRAHFWGDCPESRPLFLCSLS